LRSAKRAAGRGEHRRHRVAERGGAPRNDDIVARPAVEDVVDAATDKDVVARFAVQRLVAIAADAAPQEATRWTRSVAVGARQ
jgi:hypothetical protein